MVVETAKMVKDTPTQAIALLADKYLKAGDPISSEEQGKKQMTIEEFTGITKALSDQHRVRAFMALLRGELCACQIIELLSLAPSTVSKHMSILVTAGLVESRKDSRWVYYRLADSINKKETREIIEMTISLLQHDHIINEDDNRMKIIISDGLVYLQSQ